VIPESFIQELLARIDIVDVVERYVTLRKAGANYSACCPFHSEKTPSFTVSPSKQFYHCFGCGAHGSAIGFIMQYSGVGFIEAVEDLAHSAGVQVPQVSDRVQSERAKKAPLTDLMARAARFYREQLKASPKAIEYLKGRGLSGEIAARFGLGYAPDDWQGLQRVFPDYGDQALLECGLVIVNDQGRRYDRFRDRVMFPILDQRGNVIGFGGRFIGDHKAAQAENAAAGPKYLNSPETPLFEKGRELYGLPQARKAIHDTDSVIVVEGYMDVVGLAQLGVENVVATLGTATTGTNVQRLLKQADRVIFCFDRDEAGDKAAWRATEASLEHLADNKRIDILQMPGDQDPDEYVREHGREAFMHYANNATPLSQFILRELKRRTNPTTPEGRALLIHEATPLLQRISASKFQAQLAREIGEAAKLSLQEVATQCGLKLAARSRYGAPPPRARFAARTIEHTLLEVVLQQPAWAARIPLERITTESPQGSLIHAIADAMEHGELPAGGTGMLIEHFRGTPHESVIAGQIATLANEPPDIAELESVFVDALERLRKNDLTREIAALNEKVRSGSGSPEELRELLARKAQSQKTQPSE
jgi:DNA primase